MNEEPKHAGEPILFSFGDPEPVNNRISDYLGTFLNDAGLWFEPPVNFNGLSKMTRANAHHGTCIIFRRNMLVNELMPSKGIRRADFRAVCTDYLTFGNGFLQVIRNAFGQPVRLEHLAAINMRRGRGDRFFMMAPNFQNVEFKPGEVVHLKEYDTQQGVYGVPDWLGGLQSALLNEDATLFRRKYFKNGAHLGYILYTNDAQIGPETEQAIKTNLSQGKGAGNFRSMYLHIPNGKEKSVQLIPIGDIGQKDEFEKIKNISADDVIVAHRVPPALVAIKPGAASSLGDVEKIEGVYRRTELEAMKNPWLELNESLPPNLQIQFKDSKTA
jgi:PBSX family phage portal protein